MHLLQINFTARKRSLKPMENNMSFQDLQYIVENIISNIICLNNQFWGK